LIEELDYTKVFKIKTNETTLYFGLNSVNKMQRYIAGYSKIGVIASRTASRKSGALGDVLKLLGDKDVYVVDGPSPNPTIHEIEEMVDKLRGRGVEALIAIGGGSVIDSSKIVDVALASNVESRRVVTKELEGLRHIPLFAVNLTHGTGSEVDPYAVVNLPEEKLKIGLSVIYPVASFDDPRYTLTMPHRQIICTSIDALYHSLEAVTTKATSPYTLTVSEEAARLIFKYLPLAVKEPGDVKHRYWLLYASVLGGIAIDYSGVNIIHALEHGLSAVNRNLEHGCGLGIIGPELIKKLYSETPANLYRLLRQLSPELKPSVESAEKAGEVLREFQTSVGLKENLGSYGFDVKSVKEAIESGWAIVDTKEEFYKPVVTKEEAEKIFLSLL